MWQYKLIVNYYIVPIWTKKKILYNNILLFSQYKTEVINGKEMHVWFFYGKIYSAKNVLQSR